METRLERKLALIALSTGMTAAVSLPLFAFGTSHAFPFFTKTGLINYGFGLLLALYAFYVGWQILHHTIPFWYKFSSRSSLVHAVILFSSFIVFAAINFLYLAYYPPFQNSIDLSYFKILTPFNVFLIIFLIAMMTTISTISVRNRTMRFLDYTLFGIKYLALFLCFEQVFNIFLAYALW